MNERTYVKFHFINAQGIWNFMIEETAEMKSHDMDFEQLDLFKNIAVGDFPQWNLQILVITEEQANS